MANLLKTKPIIKSAIESVYTFSVKCQHFKSVAKHMKKCQHLGTLTVFFEHCKGWNLVLNDSQPPPTDISTSRPLNTSLQ